MTNDLATHSHTDKNGGSREIRDGEIKEMLLVFIPRGDKNVNKQDRPVTLTFLKPLGQKHA